MVFYKDTRKTDTNVGLLICVIVLLVLLLANFDKCFTPIANIFQNSNDTTQTTNNNNSVEPKPNSSSPVSKEAFQNFNLTERNLTIDPVKKTVTIKFERHDPESDKGYVLVLSQYDKNLQLVGDLDVKFVDAVKNIDETLTTTAPETTSPQTTSPGGTTTTSPEKTYQYTPICNSSNICQYTFTNVESKDRNGDLFYYRLGVGRITEDSNVKKFEVINELSFGSGTGKQRFFRVDNTLKEQKALLQKLSNLEKLKAAESAKSTQDLVESQDIDENGEVKYDVDAYMKMLKPYIGNYPDEFTLNQQKLDELSLGKYLNKSLALGSFNIDVDVADIMPKENESQ